MPREESGAVMGGVPSPLPRRARSRTCPPAAGRWGVSHSLPWAVPLVLRPSKYERGEVQSPPPSTKLEACTCAWAQVHASVYFSPSPLKALRERGTKGVRVPFPAGKGISKSAPRLPIHQSFQWVEWPRPVPPGTELGADVGAEAPMSAPVLLSPSPLQALRERGIKGVRVPRGARDEDKTQ